MTSSCKLVLSSRLHIAVASALRLFDEKISAGGFGQALELLDGSSLLWRLSLLGHDVGMSQTGVNYTDSVHDHIFVNKFLFRLREPRSGDIIVFLAFLKIFSTTQ